MGQTVSSLWSSLSSHHAQILLVGLDNAGKSTICNILQHGNRAELHSRLYAGPTIGHDVKVIDYRGIKLTILDVGGSEASQGYKPTGRGYADADDPERVQQSDRFYQNIWAHYCHGTDAVIFVVDSSDIRRLSSVNATAERNVSGMIRQTPATQQKLPSATQQQFHHNARDALHLLLSDVSLAKCAVLIFANKQDRKDALSVAEVAELLELRRLKGHRWWIQGCTAITSTDGIYEGLEWLSKELVMRDKQRSYTYKSKSSNNRDNDDLRTYMNDDER